ncbi:hypothetical protein [Symbiopectobacterium purcellii]|uniref:hypothetical protein n=1 Tax=Symbiopectobacterium purcellii TaxID=2871826 RepID=UPI003F878440
MTAYLTEENLPTVISENNITISPELTIKVIVLSNGQRVIPENDMRRACEFLGIDIRVLEKSQRAHI